VFAHLRGFDYRVTKVSYFNNRMWKKYVPTSREPIFGSGPSVSVAFPLVIPLVSLGILVCKLLVIRNLFSLFLLLAFGIKKSFQQQKLLVVNKLPATETVSSGVNSKNKIGAIIYIHEGMHK
jgi:hypothetical protein